MYLTSEQIKQKRAEYLMPCVINFYKNPPHIVRGEMQYLYDDLGNKYLDFFAGVSVMNCGHCNPFIIGRIIEQMRALQHTTQIYFTQPIVELAEKLADVLPGDIGSSFFCNSGSEATEGAMLLARLHTNKTDFIALSHGLHGRTHLSMGATAIPMWRTDANLPACFRFINNVYSAEMSLEEASRKSIAELEEALNKHAAATAAFICEAIQGNGGIITPPEWYFAEVQKLLKKHGVLMIVDEVQTGFARTGRLFCIENYGVVPDIITMAKALGNGVPIGAFSTTKEIAKSFARPSASTLGGNPVSCASAMATLTYIKQNNLEKRASELGAVLRKHLLELQNKYGFIREVRGLGLMLGMELNKDGKPLPEATDIILENLKDNGVILGKNGLDRNVLAFQPPLVINESDINYLVERLDHALKEVSKEVI